MIILWFALVFPRRTGIHTAYYYEVPTRIASVVIELEDSP